MSDFVPSGKNSDAKIIRYRPSDYEGEPLLYVLTQRQTSMLLAITAYLRWVNRYTYQPEDLDTPQKINDYIDRLDNALMVEIEFCAFMIACIKNDEDTKNALANLIVQLINENQSISEALDNQRQRSDAAYPPYSPATSADILRATDCDKDKAAGFIKTGIVDRAALLIIDFLEQWELATDEDEAAIYWADAIPVLGEAADLLSADSVVGFWNNVKDWITDAFIAEDTTAIREETYLDLLCIWENSGCTLSIEQVRDYFIMKSFQVNSGFGDALGTIVDLVNFARGMTASFSGIWYVMMGIAFEAGFVAGSILGISLPDFKFLSSLGDPTDDWIAWDALYGPCDCYTVYDSNNPVDWTVTLGLIGIEGILATSVNEPSFSNTAWLIANDIENIPLSSATKIVLVVDRPEPFFGGIQLQTGPVYDTTNPFEPYLIGPGRYAIDIILTGGVTGDVGSLNIRKLEGDIDNFKLYEIRVYSPC